MDYSSIHDERRDEENTSPGCQQVTYPVLPKLPKTERTRNAPLKAIHNNTSPTTASQPNIGRQRSACLASLANTSPRASYSRQMTSIFTSPDWKARTSAGKLCKNATVGCKAAIRSERDIVERICEDWNYGNDVLLKRRDSATSHDRPMEAHAANETNTTSSGSDEEGEEEDSLGDLERAAALSLGQSASPATVSSAKSRNPLPMSKTSAGVTSTHSSPSPQRLMSMSPAGESSSDEWTGDEEFLPRSARRRHRQQRLATKQVLASKTSQPSQPRGVLGPPPTRKRGQESPCASPRPSRFQARAQQPHARTLRNSACLSAPTNDSGGPQKVPNEPDGDL